MSNQLKEKILSYPEEIRKLSFCNWKREKRDGNSTKVPYNPLTGQRAQVDVSSTFSALEKALEALPRYDGIGTCLLELGVSIWLVAILHRPGSDSDGRCAHMSHAYRRWQIDRRMRSLMRKHGRPYIRYGKAADEEKKMCGIKAH